MIVNNTCPNVRIYSYKGTRKKDPEQCFLFPGVNGCVPEEVKECAEFKEQVECGLLVVVPRPKTAKVEIDVTRIGMQADQLAKVADLDVVEAVLDMKEKDAIALVPDITKRPTLIALRSVEKRSSISAAVESQIEKIDNLNVPTRK